MRLKIDGGTFAFACGFPSPRRQKMSSREPIPSHPLPSSPGRLGQAPAHRAEDVIHNGVVNAQREFGEDGAVARMVRVRAQPEPAVMVINTLSLQ